MVVGIEVDVEVVVVGPWLQFDVVQHETTVVVKPDTVVPGVHVWAHEYVELVMPAVVLDDVLQKAFEGDVHTDVIVGKLVAPLIVPV